VLNMNGGTITAPFINVGHLGKGVLNMNGGTINLTGQLKAPSQTGSGTVNLAGGTINAAGLYLQSTGYMDITGGTLVLDSDTVNISDVDWTIQDFVHYGWLEAYAGTGQVVIDYAMNPGKTTVYGVVPEPATMAMLSIGGILAIRRRTR